MFILFIIFMIILIIFFFGGLAFGGKAEESLGTFRNVDAYKIAYIVWNGQYAIKIVGTSHYQGNLEEIAGGKESVGKNKEKTAYIIHTPSNRYDSNACEVVIDNLVVGFLDRKSASSFVSIMGDLGYSPDTAFQVRAIIKGGWANEYSNGLYGVKLDLPNFNKIKDAISNKSLVDAVLKVQKGSCPLSKEQKRFYKWMGIRPSKEINYFNANRHIEKQIESYRNKSPEMYQKALDFRKRECDLLELIEYWRTDIYEDFNIRKPTENQIIKVVEFFEAEGVECMSLIDNEEMFFEKLIELYPKLIKE